MSAALILATAPAHQRPRNPLHLRAMASLAAMAFDLVEAYLGDDDDRVGPVTYHAETLCAAIRESYSYPPVPVEVSDQGARRLLEVSDLCWRVLSVSRKLKACPPIRKREARAITEERERWARRLHDTLIELRGLTGGAA